MILLYCKNGAVITQHDDTSSAIPAEVYGQDVRIIPWPHTIGDLQKSGPPPDPDPFTNMVMDTRPYAQPTETPELLLGYAAQVRYEVTTQGISFTTGSGTIDAKTTRLDQGLLNNLATYARTLQPTDPISFTQDNVAYAITAQEAMDLFDQVMAQVQNARKIEAECIADLTSASPTIKTYADVDTRFAGARQRKKQMPKQFRITERKREE